MWRGFFAQRRWVYLAYMHKNSAPLILRVWMFATWCLAMPMALLSRYMHRRMGADPVRFGERLGHGSNGELSEILWFHAASLGEVKQIDPLAAHLSQAADVKILVTTTTATGADWVAQEMPYAVHRFAPIDTPAAVRRFLKGWSLTAAIFVEGDLWPRMLEALDRKKVPRILLNARHSSTRKRLPRLFGEVLAPFSLITCRSQGVADDIIDLGVDAQKVRVLPDLRLTLAPPSVAQETVSALSELVGARPIWLAASTHLADDDAVLSAHSAVLDSIPDAVCIIAPRHPVRGGGLQQLCLDRGFDVARRSQGADITVTTQIYLADTLGELGALYALVPLAFLGGSFGSEGGHTPYEPAWCDTAILYGPKVANFAGAYAALTDTGAAVCVETPEDLALTLVRLMQSDDLDLMGHAGLAYMTQQQTCIETYVEMIKDALIPVKG